MLKMGSKRLIIRDTDVSRAIALSSRLRNCSIPETSGLPRSAHGAREFTRLVHATADRYGESIQAASTVPADFLNPPSLDLRRIGLYVPADYPAPRARRGLQGDCRTLDRRGGAMAVYQAALAFSTFFQVEPGRFRACCRRFHARPTATGRGDVSYQCPLRPLFLPT
jgi:hypothetical protein